jgi:hypothetical protein
MLLHQRTTRRLRWLLDPSKKIALVAASVVLMSKKDELPKIPNQMKQQELFGFMKKRAPLSCRLRTFIMER